MSSTSDEVIPDTLQTFYGLFDGRFCSRPSRSILNDTEILKQVLNDPKGISCLLKKGDIFILDRGFRDVQTLLKSGNFVVLMSVLRGKRAQLPTKEANESRMVTKCRWVVEAIHGILSKKYRLLRLIAKCCPMQAVTAR